MQIVGKVEVYGPRCGCHRRGAGHRACGGQGAARRACPGRGVGYEPGSALDGHGGLVVGCDISDWDSVQSATRQTGARYGRIDLLINSAGIEGPNTTVEDYDNDAWQQIVQINLTGTYFTNKTVITGMKARDYGRIVNIASIAGKEGNPNACAYSASNARVIGSTKSLGKELAGFDIAVNCVTPAVARTPMFDQMSQEHIDYMLSKIPRNRFLEVDEVARMIAWLASADNSFSTGAVFDLSGGWATY